MTCRPQLLLFCLAAALVGCGYIGDPLPPALNIPKAIEDLKAGQRGDRIYISFTPNFLSTDGLLLPELESVDLRAGPGGPPPFDVGRWEATARKLQVPEAKAESLLVTVPAQDWAGQDIVIGVRAQGPTGRYAAWSNWVVLNVTAPLSRPSALRATPEPEAVLLQWAPDPARPASRWRVWRQAGEEKDFTAIGESDKPEFRDPTALYGTKYAYMVQQVAPEGPSPVESDRSEPVSVSYEDRFGPPPPATVNAIGGINTIELEWEPVSAPDLAGYVIWRAEADGTFRKLGGPVSVASYSDKDVKSGIKYRYKVASLDALGNEGAPGAPIEFAAP